MQIPKLLKDHHLVVALSLLVVVVLMVTGVSCCNFSLEGFENPRYGYISNEDLRWQNLTVRPEALGLGKYTVKKCKCGAASKLEMDRLGGNHMLANVCKRCSGKVQEPEQIGTRFTATKNCNSFDSKNIGLGRRAIQSNSI